MAQTTKKTNLKELPTEIVALADLKPHPRNYVEHPDDQIIHLMKSIKKHGVYRPIVTAKELTILAGHGLRLALMRLRSTHAKIIRTPYEPDHPDALMLLAGDNEQRNLARVDDRKLTEVLRDIYDQKGDLLGTGFDEMMLANLVMVTRPANEIADFDAAAFWVGMPEYEPMEEPWRLVVHFEDKEDRDEFAKRLGIKSKLTDNIKSMWFPWRDKDDVSSIAFEVRDEDVAHAEETEE